MSGRPFAVLIVALGGCKEDKTPSTPADGSLKTDSTQQDQRAEIAQQVDMRDSPTVYPGRTWVEVYGIFSDQTGVLGCAGSTCHLPDLSGAPVTAGGDLHMGTVVEACSDLVNVRVVEAPGKTRVVPGSLADSYLWCKLTTTDCKVQEPRGQKPLAQVYLDVVKSWIENGAHCP